MLIRNPVARSGAALLAGRQLLAQTMALFALLSSACVQAQAQALDEGLKPLAWLAGCWVQAAGEAGSVEHWLPPAGGMMLGLSRIVRKGRTVEHEFLSIHLDEQGRAVYTARPSGQQPAAFTAISVEAMAVTFENLAHDFPQRIIYRASDASTLMARIEGLRGGALRHIEFPMRRSRCDDSLAAP